MKYLSLINYHITISGLNRQPMGLIGFSLDPMELDEITIGSVFLNSWPLNGRWRGLLTHVDVDPICRSNKPIASAVRV